MNNLDTILNNHLRYESFQNGSYTNIKYDKFSLFRSWKHLWRVVISNGFVSVTSHSNPIFGRIALAIPVYELAMSVCLSVRPSVRPSVCLSTFWLNFWFKQNLSYGYRYMFATWCVAYHAWCFATWCVAYHLNAWWASTIIFVSVLCNPALPSSAVSCFLKFLNFNVFPSNSNHFFCNYVKIGIPARCSAPRPTPDTNRLSGSFRVTGITERSYRRPGLPINYPGSGNPLRISYVM